MIITRIDIYTSRKTFRGVEFPKEFDCITLTNIKTYLRKQYVTLRGVQVLGWRKSNGKYKLLKY